MIIDSYRTLQSEIGTYPGNIGDSCANTSRYKHAKTRLNEPVNDVDLWAFATPAGAVRHPNAPEKDDKGESWRETDFSCDQAEPWLLAAMASDPYLASLIKDYIIHNGYRTGNGDLVSPGMFAIVKGWKWLLNLSLVGQVIIFKIPVRWNDGQKKFEDSRDDSADYLNFIHCAIESDAWVRRLIKKSVLKQKIRDYFKDEPNNQWLIDLYDRLIDKYWEA